jgi:hypothetical protein
MANNEIRIPIQLATAARTLIAQESNCPGESIEVVVIGLREGWAPGIMGTLPPETLVEVFQWLIDHQPNARTEEHFIKPVN